MGLPTLSCSACIRDANLQAPHPCTHAQPPELTTLSALVPPPLKPIHAFLLPLTHGRVSSARSHIHALSRRAIRAAAPPCALLLSTSATYFSG
ncbi:hypothetical protein MA16_Dca016901 [Dendrobium catenatum]|uniref:Uncharacterized protein n=1 Tax=Dendrobium catenatum TaxID=906689 RepID=A0A2I0W4W6_9ASPA|nr:hypothetical protein MA16_Dca016901 [Dendrobium catenatum]